jgi:AcrR family transcriptional regulator
MADVHTLSKGEQTRERLLDIAEEAILKKGFAATSIEEIIAEAGITKSGFFYHFKDKHDLSKALLLRFLEEDKAIMADVFARADALHEDPLHSFLIAMKLFADLMSDLPSSHPGCLVASYCYQEQQFSREVRELNRNSVLVWRARFRERLERIAERYPPRVPVDLDALSDMATVIVEGGIILDKLFGTKTTLPDQILQFRQLVRVLFHP